MLVQHDCLDVRLLHLQQGPQTSQGPPQPTAVEPKQFKIQ